MQRNNNFIKNSDQFKIPVSFKYNSSMPENETQQFIQNLPKVNEIKKKIAEHLLPGINCCTYNPVGIMNPKQLPTLQTNIQNIREQMISTPDNITPVRQPSMIPIQISPQTPIADGIEMITFRPQIEEFCNTGSNFLQIVSSIIFVIIIIYFVYIYI